MSGTRGAASCESDAGFDQSLCFNMPSQNRIVTDNTKNLARPRADFSGVEQFDEKGRADSRDLGRIVSGTGSRLLKRGLV